MRYNDKNEEKRITRPKPNMLSIKERKRQPKLNHAIVVRSVLVIPYFVKLKKVNMWITRNAGALLLIFDTDSKKPPRMRSGSWPMRPTSGVPSVNFP